MQVREPRMDDNRASAADNLRKISPSSVGSEKFFSTLVSKNAIFVSFTAFSQRKLFLSSSRHLVTPFDENTFLRLTRGSLSIAGG